MLCNMPRCINKYLHIDSVCIEMASFSWFALMALEGFFWAMPSFSDPIAYFLPIISSTLSHFPIHNSVKKANIKQ